MISLQHKYFHFQPTYIFKKKNLKREILLIGFDNRLWEFAQLIISDKTFKNRCLIVECICSIPPFSKKIYLRVHNTGNMIDLILFVSNFKMAFILEWYLFCNFEKLLD